MSDNIKELTKSPFDKHELYDKFYDKVIDIIDNNKEDDLYDKFEQLRDKTKNAIENHVIGNVLTNLKQDEVAELFFDKAKELGYSLNESLELPEILSKKYKMVIGEDIMEDPNYVQNITKFANQLMGYDKNDVINTLFSLRDNKDVDINISDELIGKQLNYNYEMFSKDSGIITDVKLENDKVLISYDNNTSDLISKEEYNTLINNGTVNIKGIDVMTKGEALVEENLDVETAEEDKSNVLKYNVSIENLQDDVLNMAKLFFDNEVLVEDTVIYGKDALSFTFNTDGIDMAAYWSFRNELENALDIAGIKYIKNKNSIDIMINNINESGSFNLELDIAEDLLPQVQKQKQEKGVFTVNDLEQIILRNGGSLEMLDNVVSELVNLGFEFDIDIDESIDINYLYLKFTDEAEYTKAKEIINNSEFNADEETDNATEFTFNVDSQSDADSLEYYLEELLVENDISDFHFYSDIKIDESVYVNPKDKAREIRDILKKEFPQIKFSITSTHSKITVAIMSAPINFLENSTRADRGYEQINHYTIDKYPLSDEAKEVLNRIKQIIFDEQEELVYDGDYGSVPNYYGNIEIGKWNKPFVYTGSDNTVDTENTVDEMNEGFVNRVHVNDVGDKLVTNLLEYIVAEFWRGYITDEKEEELKNYIGDLAFDLTTKEVELDNDAIINLSHELQLAPDFLANKLQAKIINNSYLFESNINEDHLTTKEDKIDYISFHTGKEKDSFSQMSDEVIDTIYLEIEQLQKISEGLNGKDFKLFEGLRSVEVTFSDGDTITTSMAQHLTDEEIYDYYEIGKEFNLGTIEDNVQSVVDVKILESNINETFKQHFGYNNSDAPWVLYDSVEAPEKVEYNHVGVKNLVMQDNFLRYMYEEMMTGNYYEDMEMMYTKYIKTDEDYLHKLKTYEKFAIYQIKEAVNKNEIGSKVVSTCSEIDLELTDDDFIDLVDMLPKVEELKEKYKQNYILLTNECKSNIKNTFEDLDIIDLLNQFKDTKLSQKDLEDDNVLETLKQFNKDSLNQFNDVLSQLKECLTTQNCSHLGLITTCLILK